MELFEEKIDNNNILTELYTDEDEEEFNSDKKSLNKSNFLVWKHNS